MNLFLMHLDDALSRQPEFLARAREKNAREANFALDARGLRLWGRQQGLNELRNKIKPLMDGKEPVVTFTGSGDFHHISQLLISCVAEKTKEKITIIHFDNHPDWVHFNGGMHCGSWVNRALELQNVDKVITIGVCSNDLKNPEFKGAGLEHLKSGKIVLFPYSRPPSFVFREYGANAGYEQRGRRIFWDNIEGQENFIDRLLPLVKTSEIYITVDKDVLSAEDVITNWDQGKMRLPVLLALLKTLIMKFNLLGLDVVGDYSTRDYAGKFFDVLKKRAEIMIDQPVNYFSDSEITARNTASNLALLELFA